MLFHVTSMLLLSLTDFLLVFESWSLFLKKKIIEYKIILLKLSGDIKRICETDLGLISQCCLTKHVFKISKQYLANVSLKINVKVLHFLRYFPLGYSQI